MKHNSIRQRKLFKKNESFMECRRHQTETTLNEDSISDISNKYECLIERRQSYSSRPTIHPSNGLSKQVTSLQHKVFKQEETMNKCLEQMQQLDEQCMEELDNLKKLYDEKIKRVYGCIKAQEQRNAISYKKYNDVIASFCQNAFYPGKPSESTSFHKSEPRKSFLTTQCTNFSENKYAKVDAQKKKQFLLKVRQELANRKVSKTQQTRPSQLVLSNIQQTLLLSLRTDRESESILLDGVSFLE